MTEKKKFHWQWRSDKSAEWNQNQLSPNENYHEMRYACLKTLSDAIISLSKYHKCLLPLIGHMTRDTRLNR